MSPIDATRLMVIVGYVLAAGLAWGFVLATKSGVRRIGGILIATYTTCWVVFYAYTSTVNVAENLSTLTLMSRVAHFPTIAGAVALIIILWDTERIGNGG